MLFKIVSQNELKYLPQYGSSCFHAVNLLFVLKIGVFRTPVSLMLVEINSIFLFVPVLLGQQWYYL